MRAFLNFCSAGITPCWRYNVPCKITGGARARQEAGNVKQMLAKGESRLELMLKMIQTARHSLQQSQDAKNEAEWNSFWSLVKQLSMRGQEAYRDEMDDLLAFVRNLSGGIDKPINLEYLRDLIRTLKTEREIPGSLYGAIAHVEIGNKHACPKFRMAILMAMAGASQQYSRNEEQSLLNISDIKSLAGKNKPYALQAERLLEAAHAMVDPSDPRQRIALYMMEVRLVHHVFRKADATRGNFKTQSDIASQFVEELSQIVQKELDNPWKAKVQSVAAPWKNKAKAASSSAASSAANPKTVASGVVQYSAAGEVVNMFELLTARASKRMAR